MDEPRAPLTIELGEGFAGDEVAVLADGEQVWHGRDVRTNYSVGLADVVELPAAAGTAEMIAIRIRNSTGDHELTLANVAPSARLRVSVDPGGSPRAGPAPEGPIF